jgi:hypothetical protein
MLNRWMSVITFVCFGLLSLMVVEMTRRPLCIDSKVVERIDRKSDAGTEVIYRCALNKSTPYSTYFAEALKTLNPRVSQLERLIENLEPFAAKVTVSIVTDRPLLFKVQGHHIFIGQKLFEAPGHLEKALAKIWFREKSDSFFVNQALMEEIVTDFVLFLNEGDLNVGDPSTNVKTSVDKKWRWPTVMQSVKSYCATPWKLSEHYVSCATDLHDFDHTVLEMSLRPLMVSAWIKSFKEMSIMDRDKFVRGLPLLIKGDHDPELPIFARYQAVGETRTAMAITGEALKNTNLYLTASQAMKNSAAYRLFMVNLTQDLRLRGLQEAFADAQFDVMLASEDSITTDSDLFKHFLNLAKAQPEIHVALRDKKNIWMLPSLDPVPVSSFEHIRATRTIVEKCGGFDFNYVLGFGAATEKLLVVEKCKSKNAVGYNRYLKDGAEGFAAENKGVAFIQFHLPSLAMKSDTLVAAGKNVFDLIKAPESSNSLVQSLGWQEIKWNEQAGAYHPKAYIDAIEWFRVAD